MRMARPSWRTPALLTSTRIGPKRSCTSSNAALTCSALPTSACTSPDVRPRRATFHPSASRRSAIAAPMPRVPPVTSAQPSWPLLRAGSGTGLATLLPADDARAPHEAGAEGGQGEGGAGHAADGVAVDLAALHAQHALVALGVEEVGLLAVGAQDEAADPQLEVV